MKERNLIYEKNFRKYLFSFSLETHLKICENINVEFKKPIMRKICLNCKNKYDERNSKCPLCFCVDIENRTDFINSDEEKLNTDEELRK